MFNDFFSKVARLSPDTLSSSLQPYRDGPDFFINTSSLAVVIQLPIKIHSIDKDYLERKEDLNKGTVKNIWDVVKSENRLLPHKTRASTGQSSSFPDSMLMQGCAQLLALRECADVVIRAQTCTKI